MGTMPPSKEEPKKEPKKEEAMDQDLKEKKEDQITSKFKARSVSLTRTDARKPTSTKKSPPPTKKISPGKGRKRKSPPEKSPVSVKERTSRFEQVRDKYKNQRCLKEINRSREVQKKEKKPKGIQDEEEGSISELLKTINANILSMKTDLKSNSQKIDNINDKIVELEVNAGKNEKVNKKRFEEINKNVNRIETNVTEKVINVIDPQIKSLKAELKSDMSNELKSLVEEEFNRRFPGNNEAIVSEDKNNKIQKKNIKSPKSKKKKMKISLP